MTYSSTSTKNQVNTVCTNDDWVVIEYVLLTICLTINWVASFLLHYTFLGKNLLQFAQVNVSKKYDFGNKMLRVLTLSLYYVGLSEGMMHPLVFKRMRELKIENVLTNIETGVLDKFTSLRNLDLKLDNFRDFFHQILIYL